MKTNSCGASSLSPSFFFSPFLQEECCEVRVVIVCAFLSRLSFASNCPALYVKFLPLYARACLALHSAGQMSSNPLPPGR